MSLYTLNKNIQSDGAMAVFAATVAMTGTNPVVVNTGLRSIDCAQVTLNQSATPGDTTSVVTFTVAGGVISIYGWMNTTGSDPTLVAGTGTPNVGVFAVGAL